jgi:hypothetical protein
MLRALGIIIMHPGKPLPAEFQVAFGRIFPVVDLKSAVV